MLSPLSHHESLNWTADHFPLCVFGACFLFGCVFVCFVALGVFFLFAVLLFGIVTAAGLCTGPIPVHSCGPLPMEANCMHQLGNLLVLCNMQSNVLNDLAKAKRRWTEEKLGQNVLVRDRHEGYLPEHSK